MYAGCKTTDDLAVIMFIKYVQSDIKYISIRYPQNQLCKTRMSMSLYKFTIMAEINSLKAVVRYGAIFLVKNASRNGLVPHRPNPVLEPQLTPCKTHRIN